MTQITRRLAYGVVLITCLTVACFLLAQPASTVPSADASKIADAIHESLDSQTGLCVHLGPRDGKLTTALSADGKFLVHGLCEDDHSVDSVRETIASTGLEGAVSCETGALDRLPYADRIVNLLVADNLPKLVDEGLQVDEVMRVLRPGGVAWFGVRDLEGDAPSLAKIFAKAGGGDEYKVSRKAGVWLVVTKPRPKELDAWTHKRHEPDNNPVSHDALVGLPSGVRWVAGPNWPTGDRKAVIGSVVASEDRLVYVFADEDQTEDGPKRFHALIARDAFNGLLLWRQETTASSRALVSVDDRVYTVIKKDGPLVALDVETGKVVRSYENTREPQEVAYIDGNLLVDQPDGLASINAETGKVNWKHEPRPSKFLIGDGHVFVQEEGRAKSGERVTQISSLELGTGKPEWSAATDSWSKSRPSLIFYHDGILVAHASDGNHGISAKDGSHLWQYSYPRIGHGGSFEKVLYMHGLVWVHTASVGNTRQYAWEGLDPQTGEVKKRVIQPRDFTYKHRCNYDVATQRYFVCGSMDFADVETGEYSHFTAARNSCRTGGTIPANGLLYTFPHACGCFPMLRGFMGLADTGEPELITPDNSDTRLIKGPAYDESLTSEGASDSDWPTYRRNNVRSASTTSAGPEKLDLLWRAKLATEPPPLDAEWDLKDGGRVTGPIVTSDIAVAAAVDNHRVSAFNAQSGEPIWQFTASGRVDCPPTISDGRCLFGSRDGWVYCLRATDGQLIWRFRAAPDDRRIVAYGQLESPWPIVGGVLAYEGLAYFVAGRHEGADGGVFVHAVKPETGELVWINRPEDYTGVPDVLNAADGTIQMASYAFDAKTGEKVGGETRLRGGRIGLLNDAWYKRPIAMRKNLQLWTGGGNKTGQMFTFSPNATCGFRACKSVSGGNGTMSGDATLFAIPEDRDKNKTWQITMPNTSRLKGMVVAADRLYVAGRLEVDGELQYVVRSYGLKDGKQLAQHIIKSDFVHDCLAVAWGRVYVTTQGGDLICLGEK